MCVAVLSTAHPSYSLILINNRDEFLNRPTAPAEWWSNEGAEILSGRDLLRPAQGTWLGLTKDGRIAVLTNFREDVTPPLSAISRGVILKDFLKADNKGSTLDWVKSWVATGKGRDVGGFSLVCGRLAAHTGKPEHKGFAVFSNRVELEGDVDWICGEANSRKAIGLSNAAFAGPEAGDRWKKVVDGERLMDEAVRTSQEINENENQLIERLLGVLSTDTLPRAKDGIDGGLDTYINQLRKTVFVPAVGRKDSLNVPVNNIAAAKMNEKAEIIQDTAKLGVSGLYGTQKQTVILVDRAGKVRYFERTLYDNDVNQIPIGEGDRDFQFDIEC